MPVTHAPCSIASNGGRSPVASVIRGPAAAQGWQRMTGEPTASALFRNGDGARRATWARGITNANQIGLHLRKMGCSPIFLPCRDGLICPPFEEVGQHGVALAPTSVCLSALGAARYCRQPAATTPFRPRCPGRGTLSTVSVQGCSRNGGGVPPPSHSCAAS